MGFLCRIIRRRWNTAKWMLVIAMVFCLYMVYEKLGNFNEKVPDKCLGVDEAKQFCQPDSQREAKLNDRIRQLMDNIVEGQTRTITPLVIVEEHHEVIPYWFQAADQGHLPRSGNVLVHIDAHADATLPIITSSFPLFRYPGLSELVQLMQRNDMFISGAALTGFINRYIWIIPQWDTRLQNASIPSGYGRYHIFVGLVQTADSVKGGVDAEFEIISDGRQRKGHENAPQICFCVGRPTRDNDVEKSTECFVNTKESTDDPFGISGSMIPRYACRPRLHVLAEIVMEDKAIKLMEAEDGPRDIYDLWVNSPEPEDMYPAPFSHTKETVPWLDKHSSIILDIDEDYYGVEAAITPLLNAGISASFIDNLSYVISQIFCPKHAEGELFADFIFYRLIQNLILCRKDKDCTENFDSHIQTYWSLLREDLKHETAEKCVCNTTNSDRFVASIVILVKNLGFLDSEQLRALGQVGICLRESPQAMTFNATRGMKICTGHNRPGHSAVMFHVPDKEELNARSMKLFCLFKHSEFIPKLITIARSVRDGYTPRNSARRIEKDLLYILRNFYPHIDQYSIIYDHLLLGGVDGWADRHEGLDDIIFS